MTNEELADLIVARTGNLRDHFDRRLAEQDTRLDRTLAEMDAHDVDRLMILEAHLREHFDAKLSALQAHVYGKLLSVESDMLDLRGDILKLREAVSAQARALEERR